MNGTFDDFFNNEMKPYLDELNKKRKNVRRMKNTLITIFILMFANPFFSSILTGTKFEFIIPIVFFLFFPLFIFIFIFTFIVSSKTTKYEKEYKEKVLTKITKYINPSFKYEYFFDAYALLNRTQLYRDAHHVKCDDALLGEIDNQNFGIFDIYAYDIHRDNDGDTHKKTIFKGMILSLELKNQDIFNTLTVKPKNALLDGISNFFNKDKSNTENSEQHLDEFSQLFNVDKDKEDMVLSENLKTLLVELHHREFNPRLSLANGFVYLTLSIKRDPFDLPLNHELSKESILSIIEEFNYYISLIDKLKK